MNDKFTKGPGCQVPPWGPESNLSSNPLNDI